MGQAAMGAATSPLRKAAAALKDSYGQGARRAVTATGGTISRAAPAAAAETPAEPPAWARAMKHRQSITHGASLASHTLKGGDSHGGGSGPDITDKS